MSSASHNKHQHNRNEVPSSDWIGFGLSGLCTLHCLALPLLTSILPFTEASHENERLFHVLMAVMIVPLGLWAFLRGYRIHKRLRLTLIGFVGLGLVLVGLLGDDHAHGTWWTSLGSVVLMLSHLRNWRLTRCEACRQPSMFETKTPPKSPGDLKFDDWTDGPAYPLQANSSLGNKFDPRAESAATREKFVDAGHGG